MIKFWGATLVIFACFSLALKHIIKKQNTIAALKNTAETLQNIARAIGFQLEPLPRIIKTLAHEQANSQDSFIQHLNRSAQGNLLFADAWQQALCDFCCENAIPAPAKTILEDVGMHIGKADAKTEELRLVSAAERITALCNEAEEEHKKTEKMTQSLGVIAGIFIVILLL